MITLFDIINDNLKGKFCKFICSQKTDKRNFEGVFKKVNFFDKDKSLLCIDVEIDGEVQKKYINVWFVRIEIKGEK